MTEYQELKKRFKKIGLTVVKTNASLISGVQYHIYFSGGIQKGIHLANASNIKGLKELLKINE